MNIIEQAKYIAKNGCEHIKNCQSQCLLSRHGCKDLYRYEDGKIVARVFLAGMAYVFNNAYHDKHERILENGEFSEHQI